MPLPFQFDNSDCDCDFFSLFFLLSQRSQAAATISLKFAIFVVVVQINESAAHSLRRHKKSREQQEDCSDENEAEHAKEAHERVSGSLEERRAR